MLMCYFGLLIIRRKWEANYKNCIFVTNGLGIYFLFYNWCISYFYNIISAVNFWRQNCLKINFDIKFQTQYWKAKYDFARAAMTFISSFGGRKMKMSGYAKLITEQIRGIKACYPLVN